MLLGKVVAKRLIIYTGQKLWEKMVKRKRNGFITQGIEIQSVLSIKVDIFRKE